MNKEETLARAMFEIPEVIEIWDMTKPSDRVVLGDTPMVYGIVIVRRDDAIEGAIQRAARAVQQETQEGLDYLIVSEEELSREPRAQTGRLLRKRDGTPLGVLMRGGEPARLALREAVNLAFGDMPEIAHVALGPRPDGPVVLLFRTTFAPNEGISEELKAQLVVRKAKLPPCELICAPEDNYPPQGIDADEPTDGLLGLSLRAFEPVTGVEALYVNHDVVPTKVIIRMAPGSSDRAASTMGVVAAIEHIRKRLGENVDFEYMERDPQQSLHLQIPREASCFFNNITRRIKAEMEGEQRMATEAKVAPGGFISCRWCDFKVPAPNHPAYKPDDPCPSCGAAQNPVTIQTRNRHIPRFDVYVNPDGSIYFEVVAAPPAGKSLAHARVSRYVVPAPTEVFNAHPFGRRNPK